MIWVVRTLSWKVFKNDLHPHSVMDWVPGPMERHQDKNLPTLPPKSRGYKTCGDMSAPRINLFARPNRLPADWEQCPGKGKEVSKKG